jgi:hypothetical protein
MEVVWLIDVLKKSHFLSWMTIVLKESCIET